MFELTLKSQKSIFEGIKLFEVFNKTNIDKLLNSDLLLKTPHKHIQKKFETEKQQIQEYKDLSIDIDNEDKEDNTTYGMTAVVYNKCKGYTFGRVYPRKSLSLCTIRREIRHTISKDIYIDIDATNAHPEIIYQTCKYHSIKCDKLEDYVKNRMKHLEDIMKHYNVVKEKAKLLFIVLLYFGSFNTWVRECKLPSNTEPTQFIKEFIEQRDEYAKSIIEANDDICIEVQKNKVKVNKFEYNENASVIAIWCQEMENRILETIYKYCIKKDYITDKIAVLCYDGIMIEKKNFNEKILKEFENLIEKEYGYKLKYVSKPLNEGYNDKLDEKIEINDDYEIDDKLKDKEFFKQLETYSHKQCAEQYHKLKPSKYVYSYKTGWYKYNEYNVLKSFGKEFPDDINNDISKTLQDYLIPIRNRMMPNHSSYIKNSKNINRLITNVNNATFVSGILKFMKELYASEDIDDKIDNNTNLIAFDNKVFDRTIYKFRDIKKEDYINKTTKYKYDESNKTIRKEIKKIIQSIFENNENEQYFYRVKAYSLFGNNDESCIIQVGSGGNGKGLISTVENKALGEYISTTENTFLTSAFKQGSANPTLSASKGLRTLIVSEPSEEDENGRSVSLNTPFLKLITGKDDITTRALYQSNMTFKPLFTPFLQCNTLPDIKKIDKGIMRRIKVITFPFSFVEIPKETYERKIDKSLKSKLDTIEYAREYLLMLLDIIINEKDKKDKNIIIPKSVQDDTDKYFIENNPVKLYLDAFTIKEEGAKIKSSTLKEHYDEHTETKLTIKSFIKSISANGISNYMSSGYRYFKDIKLKDEN